MFRNNKEIFSIRKFKNGRSDSVKIGALALLMGSALALGGGEAQAQTVAIDKAVGPAEGATSMTTPVETYNGMKPDATLNMFVQEGNPGDGSVTKQANLEVEYKFVDDTTKQEITTPVKETSATTYEVTHDTASITGANGEDIEDNIDGKEYANNTPVEVKDEDKFKEATDTNAGAEPQPGDVKTVDGKKYEYIRTEVTTLGEPTFNESFNDAKVDVTTDQLHTADAEIDYPKLAGGRVFLVEELSEGKYGKVVLTDGVASDQDVADKFYAGLPTAQVISQEELNRLGGIKENDFILVLDRDNYVVKETNGITFNGGITDGNTQGALDYITDELKKFGLTDLMSVENPKTANTTIRLPHDSIKDQFGRPVVETDKAMFGVLDMTNVVGPNITTDVELGNATVYDYLTTLTPLRAYKVGAKDTVITHFYREQKGSVVVHYVNTAGEVIKDPYADLTEVPTTEKFNTQENATEKPETIKVGEVTYRFKEVAADASADSTVTIDDVDNHFSATPTGDVVKGTTHVIFVYEPVLGNVKTYYVDETGKELKTPFEDIVNGNLDAAYDTAETEDEQPKEFEVDGVTYRHKEVATQGTVGATAVVTADDKNFIGTVAGTVKEGTTHVINVYAPVTGDVKVYFVDEAGKELKAPFEDTNDENLKAPYEVTETEAPTEFKVGDVTYRFVEDAKAGKVGEVQVAPEDTTNVVAGSTGTVVEGTTHVIKVYKPVLGDVKAYFVDENGKQLKAPFEDTKQGNLDANYELTDAEAPKEFVVDGVTYRFKEVSQTPDVAGTQVAPVEDASNFVGQPTGTVKEGTTHIVNVYAPVTGDVKTYYVDETGKELKAPAVDTDKGNLNAPYNAAETDVEQPKEFEVDGVTYRLKEVATQGTVGTTAIVTADDKNFIGAVEGTVKEGTTHVINVYAPVTGDVKAYFVDETGKELKAPFEDTNDGNLKAGYELTDEEAPKEFKVGDVTYRFKEVSPTPTVGGTAVAPTSDKDFVGQATGTVVEGTTHIVNVYTPVLGDVTIHFVDKEGNKIQEPVTDTVKGNLDAAYEVTGDTEQPKTIKVGDVTYRFTTVSPEATVGGKEVVTTDATNFVGTGTGTVKEGVTHVINVYEPVLGNVKAYFVDEAGNELQAPVEDTVNGNLDAPYNAAEGTEQPKEIKVGDKVYRLKTVSTSGTVGEKAVVTEDGSNFIGAAEGTVKEGTTHVINVYEEVKGDVVIKYVDEAGNPITGAGDNGQEVTGPKEDTPKSSLGTDYDTTDFKPNRITTADGRIFELVPTSTIGNETGDVVEGTTEVTYVYKEVKGDVVIKYVDEAGNPLTGAGDNGQEVTGPKEDTPKSSVGTDYDTTDFKPKTITTAEGKTYELVPTSTIGNETGDVVEGTTEVTYVYKEVKGDVVIKYVDEAGNPITGAGDNGQEVTGPKEDTPLSSTGTDYDTTDFKPNRITTADGRIFELVPTSTIGKETGDVVVGTTEVTYVYKEVKGDVIIKYVDEAGNPITGAGDNGQEVTGPKEDTPKSSVGTDYDTTDFKPKTITTAEGKTYELVPTSTIGNETGDVVEGTTEITYVYKEIKGNVVVNYVDEEGNVLKDPTEDTPESSTGTPYDTTDNKPTTITTENGKTYELVPEKTEGTEGGKVTPGTNNVTYVYKEVKGDVVIKYVDEAGNPLTGAGDNGQEVTGPKEDTPLSSTGTDYDTTDFKPNRITTADGRIFELVPASTIGKETGDVVVGTTEVTYVYKEVKGTVVVNYVTETGEVIKTPVTDTENGSVGSPYNTTDNKPTTITTEDGRTFELVPEKTEGTEDGKVTEGTSQVTYVYKEVKGDVVIKYVDEAGNPLTGAGDNGQEVTGPKEDTPLSSTGTDYDTTDFKPNRITTADGRIFELVPASTIGKETGDVVVGTTEVTYVYKEVKGTVVVNYVTESGEVIKTPVTDTENGSVGTPYDTTDNKPTTITTEDGRTFELVPEKTEGTEDGKVTEG
ncbi:MAG: MucBP domain-containing protein, partial [Gemella sp.]|nr:MucBP domain-containing protein [Gemella sp.]